MRSPWRALLPVLAVALFTLSAAEGRAPLGAGAADLAAVVGQGPGQVDPIAMVGSEPVKPDADPTPVPTPTVTPQVAPYVQSFAEQPGVPTKEALPSPTATATKLRTNVDGCDHGYKMAEKPTMCVPWTFPASASDKCAYLRTNNYFKPPADNPTATPRLMVVTTLPDPDRHDLDLDGDGEACEESA
jgi:hypothetical protein